MSANALRRGAGVASMSFAARSASALTLLCLVACGSGGGGAGQPTLTLSPQTATAILGGPAVTFTASLSGSSNPISWTLSGPGSIAPSGGSTAAYTPPPFGGTAMTATVTASAGSGLSASATVHVDVPAAIDVSGRVIGSDLVPIAGVNVTIGAKSALTNADGGFTISSVPPPYDLTAVAPSPKKVGVLYQGLTRRDPTILMPGMTASTSTGTLTGNVTGGNPLGAADEVTRLIFGSPDIPDWLVNNAQTNVTSNPYTLNPSWVGPSATTGTVHVLQWRLDANNRPASFTGYASTPGVSISSGGTASADLVMSAPPASTIGGTIHLAPSLSYFGQTLSIVFPGTPPTFLGADTPSGSFSYPFPDVSGATATLIATALYAGTNVSATELAGISPGTANVVVDLPTPCTAVVPADHATNVGTTTDFTWTPMTGTVYVLFLLGSGTSPSYFVFTAATSARIPDLSAQGLGLSGAFRWDVNAFGPVASVDDLAGAAALHLVGAGSYFGGTTSPRDFTNP